jgi:hypothetical protein
MEKTKKKKKKKPLGQKEPGFFIIFMLLFGSFSQKLNKKRGLFYRIELNGCKLNNKHSFVHINQLFLLNS